MDVFDQLDTALGWPIGTAALLVAAICGACAFIARFLSAPDDGAGPLYRLLYGLINKLGQNGGKAANADDVEKLNALHAADKER